MIPILYMTTGAVLALGLFHVFLAMKGLHKRAHLAFFITCLAGVVYALLSIKVFESVSVAEYMSYVRIRMFAFGVLFPALAWFIAFYTGVVHRPALTTLTVIWLATPLVRMIDPSTTLVYGEIRGLRNIQVFTGEHLALLDADVSLFGIGLYLLIFGIYGHIIYTAWRLHQAGHKYYTGLLILSLLAFFGSVVHDIAQEAFQLPTPPLGEFGFLFVIGFMSLGVAEEVLQVNTVKAKLWEANRDRNTASRARQATEARLRLLIDSMSDVVWLSSDDGTLFLASPSVASTFGFTLSRYLTLSLEERVAPEDLPKLREALAAIAHRGGASGVVTQIRYLRQDGSQVLCEVTLSQVPAHDGVDRGVLSIIRDITARVEIEDRLRQSEKAQVIGQLAGGVAHDFNNQLAGILGFAELLRDDLEDRPEQREDAIRIIRSAERATGLTRRLLMFSRKRSAVTEDVDVHLLLEEVVHLLQKGVAAQLQISTDLRATSFVVRGDSAQIQNAFLNLGINARDATDDATGTLSIQTRTVPAAAVPGIEHPTSAVFLEVLVRDNGTGMDEQTRRRAFEPYFTTKGEGKGTGLGLAGVYGMVQSHFGTIEVQSALGRGTTFALYLPTLSQGQRQASDPIEQIMGPIGSQQRILVVDDEQDICTFAVEVLQRAGFSAQTCARPDQMVSTLSAHASAPQLLVLDLRMPGLDTLDLFQRIQAVHPSISAVVTSGISPSARESEVIEARGLGFLPKPYTHQALLHAVKAQLRLEA